MSTALAATPWAAELSGMRPYLMRVALSRMRDRDAAEDVVQDTLVAACGSGGSFNGRSTLRTWVTGILLHKVTDAFRAIGREAGAFKSDHAAEDDDADFAHDGSWRAPVSAWSDPGLALECSRFRVQFEAQLAKLPALQSRAFMMREVMGLDADEICAALDISPSNLWVLLHRARLALRQGLDREYFSRKPA